MKDISTIPCKLNQKENIEYKNIPKGECHRGKGLVYDKYAGYRCLQENGTFGHCIRVTSDGDMTTYFNVKDAFKVSLVVNDLNRLKVNTIKNADKDKSFVTLSVDEWKQWASNNNLNI